MKRYSMSFTTAALLHRESMIVARLFDETKDWKTVQKVVLDENLMQVKRARSALNFYREVKSRLVLLTPEQFEFLLDTDHQGELNILWLSVCKRFPFIGEFASEVVREKFLRLDLHLDRQDYDVFFNAKAAWDERLENLTEATKGKQRPMVFAMLREADLLTPDGYIRPPVLSRRFIEVVAKENARQLAIFPVSEDIMHL